MNSLLDSSLSICFWVLFLVGAALSPLVAQTASSPTSTTQFKAPEHPVTSEQLHAFFNVCHIPGVSRGLLHEKLELQRKELPPWYPSAVWDEIEGAIEHMELAETGLPVYQKYLSEERAAFLIKLLSMPEQRGFVNSFMEANVRAQHAGATPTEALKIARSYVGPEEDREVTRIANNMSPAERRHFVAHVSDLQILQPLLAQLQKEYSQAVVDKQLELTRVIAKNHETEQTEAKRRYDASH